MPGQGLAYMTAVLGEFSFLNKVVQSLYHRSIYDANCLDILHWSSDRVAGPQNHRGEENGKNMSFAAYGNRCPQSTPGFPSIASQQLVVHGPKHDTISSQTREAMNV